MCRSAASFLEVTLMRCRTAHVLLARQLSEPISPEAGRALERHLGRCRDCREEGREIEERGRGHQNRALPLDELPAVRPDHPPSPRPSAPGSRLPLALAAAAAIALAACAAVPLLR